MVKALAKFRWKLIGIVAVASISCLIWLIFVPSRRTLIEMRYRAQGFQMVRGCNGGAAVEASGQVLTLKQELDEFADAPGVNTNIIAQLRNALVIAEDKERVLSDDCARRGHR